MNIKELEKLVKFEDLKNWRGDALTEKEAFSTVMTAVKKRIQEILLENKIKCYAVESHSNVLVYCGSLFEDHKVVIKVKKTMHKDGPYCGTDYVYKGIEVQCEDDLTFEQFIAAFTDKLEAKENKRLKAENDFKTVLKEFNVSAEDFIVMKTVFDSLDWNTRHEFEKLV